jgi:hypothetical protein
VTDEQTIAALRDAMSTAVRDHHLEPGAAATAWYSAHTLRQRAGYHLAIAASVLAVAGVAAALAVWSSRGPLPTSPPPNRSACGETATTAPLPTWARTGFSPAGLHTPHVISDQGQIVAVLFVPLRVHQPAGTYNKVLWVARVGHGPLHIRAQLQGTSQTVTTDLPNGPGPSYVNMPAAGCWQMSLTWSGYHDTIALQYQP